VFDTIPSTNSIVSMACRIKRKEGGEGEEGRRMEGGGEVEEGRRTEGGGEVEEGKRTVGGGEREAGMIRKD
jgi:hypothetical protein